MDFYNLYAHGFARVAACTGPISLVQPRVNAETALAQAREAAAQGACLAVFPELNLTGYSIEDLLLQDTVLAAAEDALAWLVPATADLGCVLVVGAPLASLNRVYNCAVVIHRGQVLGVVPKSYLPTYREFYESRQIGRGDDVTGEIRVAGQDAPFDSDLLFAAEDVPGFEIGRAHV
jgi:NAD+ synthase (glutamine-hydrolysing)